MNARAETVQLSPEATPPAASPNPRLRAFSPPLRRLFTASAVVLAVGAAIAAAYGGWLALTPFESTDDAYIKGDLTYVSTKVAGYVTEVATENNQRVVPGQILARIDPRDFQAAVRDAQAAVAQQRAALVQLDAQVLLQQAQIRSAQAATLNAAAQSHKAAEDFRRAAALVDEGGVSRSVFEQASAEKVRTETAQDQSSAQAEVATRQLGVLAAQRNAIDAAMQGAQARLLRAGNDLAATAIVAPREGLVAARSVRVGEYVNASTRLMAVAPTQGLWVEANLRETQMARLQPGDRVQIKVDAVSEHLFCGVVESLAGASGAEFALLPPDNATGNFTKIVRRFPVRILLDANQPGIDRLGAGMSVEPRIAIGSHDPVHMQHGGFASWFAGSFSCAAGEGGRS